MSSILKWATKDCTDINTSLACLTLLSQLTNINASVIGLTSGRRLNTVVKLRLRLRIRAPGSMFLHPRNRRHAVLLCSLRFVLVRLWCQMDIRIRTSHDVSGTGYVQKNLQRDSSEEQLDGMRGDCFRDVSYACVVKWYAWRLIQDDGLKLPSVA